MWLSDEQMIVLFECREFDGPHHIGSAPLEYISNKEVVQEYLDKVDHIPHIQKTVKMESTRDLQIANYI